MGSLLLNMDPEKNPITWTAGILLAIVAIVASVKKIAHWIACFWRYCVNRFNAIPNLTRTLQELADALKAQDSRFAATEESIKSVRDLAIIAHAQGLMILESNPIPMWHCELPSGVCTWVNDALCKEFHISKEDALNWGWTRSLHPDDIAPTMDRFMTSVRDGRPYKARYRVMDVNNNPTTYEASGEVVKGSSGAAIALFGVAKALPVHL